MSRRGWWPLLVLALLFTLSVAPVVAQDGAEATSTPEPAASVYDPFAVIPIDAGDDEGPLDRVARDPVGNGIAVLVLVLLLVSLIAAPWLAVRGSLAAPPGWLVPALVVTGIAVAAYLATIETNGSEAICGPVGDCNAVQDSEYATILGVHVGVLGLVGYALIGLLWVIARIARGGVADVALVLMALGALFGVAFSAYLTFLEPFVIGATCLWCITSALLMAALLWASAGSGWSAWVRLRRGTR